MKHYPRLKDLREDNDEKQAAIANILGITQQQYGLYETGKREIPTHLLIILARHYNVSIDYLTGMISSPHAIEEKTTATNSSLSAKEKQLINAYRSNPQFQNAVDKLLDIK